MYNDWEKLCLDFQVSQDTGKLFTAQWHLNYSDLEYDDYETISDPFLIQTKNGQIHLRLLIRKYTVHWEDDVRLIAVLCRDTYENDIQDIKLNVSFVNYNRLKKLYLYQNLGVEDEEQDLPPGFPDRLCRRDECVGFFWIQESDLVYENNGIKLSCKIQDTEKHLSQLSLDNGKLLKTGNYSNCTIICGTEELKCHKCILTTRHGFKSLYSPLSVILACMT